MRWGQHRHACPTKWTRSATWASTSTPMGAPEGLPQPSSETLPSTAWVTRSRRPSPRSRMSRAQSWSSPSWSRRPYFRRSSSVAGCRLTPELPLMVWSCWLADEISRADADRAAALRSDSAARRPHRSSESSRDRDPRRRWVRGGPAGGDDLRRQRQLLRPGPTRSATSTCVAIGQDRGRDYSTLVRRVDGTDLTLDLVCRPENLTGLEMPRERSRPRSHPPRAVQVDCCTARRSWRCRLACSPIRRARVSRSRRRPADAASLPLTLRPWPTTSATAVRACWCRRATLVVWRAALLGLRDDDDRRRQLGAAARQAVETRYNARHMWHELAEVMRQRGLVA